MSRKTNGALAQVWRERLERQSRGRWSVAEFCRREGVSQAAFYQWRKRLGPSQSPRLGPDREGPFSDRPLFVPVEVTSPAVSAGVEIELPGGAVVRLPHDASRELVATAVQAACLSNSVQEEQPC